MKTRFTKVTAVLIAFVMLFALVACSQQSNPNPTNAPADTTAAPASTEAVTGQEAQTVSPGGGDYSEDEVAEQVDTVVFASSMNNINIQPFGPSSGGREAVSGLIYAGLIYRPFFGAELDDCQPNLAKTVTKVDDYTYDVELFDYIHDSKGNPITAEDIKFSYEQCIEVGNPNILAPNLDEIIINDDYHLTFKLKNAGAGIIENVLGNYKLCIVSKAWYESASDDEKATDPATLARYYVSSIQNDSNAVFELVEDYWQTDEQYVADINQPRVKKIIIRAIKEESMRTIALETGEIDAAKIGNTDAPKFFDASTGEALEGWTVGIATHPGYYCVKLNGSENSVFGDNWNLRMAVLCAINGAEIQMAEGLSDFDSEVVSGYVTKPMNGYSPALLIDEYYPKEKAAEYLEASGYKPGELTLRLLAKNSLPQEAVDMIMSALDSIGIAVVVDTPNSSLEPSLANDATAWDLQYTSYRGDGNMTDVLNAVFDPSNWGEDLYNGCFYKDEHLTELLQKASFTGAEEDLKALSDYLYDQAIFKATISEYTYFVAKDDILAFGFDSGLNTGQTLYTYSKDYVSVADK